MYAVNNIHTLKISLHRIEQHSCNRTCLSLSERRFYSSSCLERFVNILYCYAFFRCWSISTTDPFISLPCILAIHISGRFRPVKPEAWFRFRTCLTFIYLSSILVISMMTNRNNELVAFLTLVQYD